MKWLGVYALIVVVAFAGMVVLRENRRPATVAPTTIDFGPKIATISQGEGVTLEDHLSEGVWTVVEFGAEWCPACRQQSPKIEAIVRSKQLCNLRRIDIDKWGSAVVTQYRIDRIPTVWLFRGKTLHSEDTNEIMKVLRTLQ